MRTVQINKLLGQLLIAVFALAVSSYCVAQTVVIGAEDDWYPYCGKVNGEAKGFAVDVVRAAFSAVNIEVKFESLPYARCLNSVRGGKLLGCFNTTRTNIIEKDFLWHAPPLFKAKINIYSLASNPETGLTTEKLEGKTVGVTNGYEYGDAFDKNTKIVRDVGMQDLNGFKKLLVGRVQYVVAFERVADYLIAAHAKEFAGKFKVAGLNAEVDLYLAFSKDYPGAPKLVEQFGQGLQTIRKNGTYKAIEARWN